MIRQSKFLASLSLYAIDLSSLTRLEIGRIESSGAPLYRYEINAVWFKRRNGMDTANCGYLWDISSDLHEESDPLEATTFLSYTLTDGRYGATCQTRWDGERLWSDPLLDLKSQQADTKFLKMMLKSFPRIPAGYDGWWRF